MKFSKGQASKPSLSLILAGLLLYTLIVPDTVVSFHQQSVRKTSDSMVSLSGQPYISFRRSAVLKARNAASRNGPGAAIAATDKDPSRRPADPRSVIQTPEHLEEKASQLAEWLSSKRNVFCLTGAGLSTDSGIPDYRGHKGSYHVGHKPIIHQQFMDSPHHRRRYWGRSMVGWKQFDLAKPNKGHYSLAALEQMGKLGVDMEDRVEFYDDLDRDDFLFTSGQRRLTILTQNVDSLHRRAGSKDVLALHGENQVVRCMNCGHRLARNDYQQQLEENNKMWLDEHISRLREEETRASHRRQQQQQTQLRPDGDADLQQANYDEVQLPSCPNCSSGFFKPDVVFFGDTVPKHRVTICQQAVEDCDGILVVGSSLAVHSAFRHVRAASKRGISVAILNVGDTRAEAEGLEGLTKIEAPIGDTLEKCAQLLGNESKKSSSS
jgi:NAD-dependent deacetylase sirtuin 4